MESKKEAKELVEKLAKILYHKDDSFDDLTKEGQKVVKQCALISNQREIDLINRLHTDGRIKIWTKDWYLDELKDVKTEIKKL